MSQAKTNLVLIGMPGVGKSTVGVLLAKRCGMRFVDTDLMIQAGEGRSLRRLIEIHGMRRFCEIESAYVCKVDVANTVVATGGSVVYYPEAMEHLRQIGRIVYLQLPLDELASRLGDLNERGVVLEPTETLASLYEKRIGLYEQWADVTVNLSQLGHEAAVEAVLGMISD